ncbi:hypothetical protein Tco_1320326 [Tanacetum coccineum]
MYQTAFFLEDDEDLTACPTCGESSGRDLMMAIRHGGNRWCVSSPLQFTALRTIDEKFLEIAEESAHVPKRDRWMNARLDLAELGVKPELFAMQEEDKTTLPPAGHVRNRNKPEGCIAKETIAEETIEFFSEYHKSMETIGIPPDKHETYENEEGKPLLAGKSSEVSAELFQKAHLYVIRNTDEIVPYIE